MRPITAGVPGAAHIRDAADQLPPAHSALGLKTN